MSSEDEFPSAYYGDETESERQQAEEIAILKRRQAAIIKIGALTQEIENAMFDCYMKAARASGSIEEIIAELKKLPPAPRHDEREDPLGPLIRLLFRAKNGFMRLISFGPSKP